MHQRILSLREAPFDLTAGVLCSPYRHVLRRWREPERRLSVWHRNLSREILGFLKKDSTAACMRRLDSVSFDVHVEDDRVRLQYRDFTHDFEVPENIRDKTTFFELFGGDHESAPFVRDVEDRARQAASLFKSRSLRTKMRTLTHEESKSEAARFHVDFAVTMAVMYGVHATKIAHPDVAKCEEYDPASYVSHYYQCDDRSRIRMLEQGDVCIIGEMAHASPTIEDFGENAPIDRGGPWLSFYSLGAHNPSFARAGLT